MGAIDDDGMELAAGRLCPVCVAEASSSGGSDSLVQVELFQETLMSCLGFCATRGRPGGSYSTATRYTDDGRFGVPSGRSGASTGVTR